MNKKDSELCQESIEHWERMVDKMKWLIESGLREEIDEYHCDEIPYILGEYWGTKDCSLCQNYWETSKCMSCPLSFVKKECMREFSPYMMIVDAHNMQQFIENAEEYMIPALKEARAFCLEKEKNDRIYKTKTKQ